MIIHKHKTYINGLQVQVFGKDHDINAFHKNPCTRADHNLSCYIDDMKNYKQAGYLDEYNLKKLKGD